MEKDNVNSLMYEEEELRDAVVVDREGYVCGRVANFTVEPDQIMVNLCEYDTKTVKTPNEEELVQKLTKLMPQKGLFHRETSIEQFYDWIREMLHLSNREPVTLEHLVEFAKVKNVDVPYQTNEFKVKIEKGSIKWSCVDKIGVAELGKCIFLNEAVEAKKRGIALSEKVDYKATKYLTGTMVIDSEAKIVGSALKFLVGDLPGLLINVERLEKIEQLDAKAMTDTLVPSMFKDSSQLLNRVKNDLNRKVVTDDDLRIWARKNKINAPSKIVERKEILMELRVDWNNIAKIGDIVILKEPIDALNEKLLLGPNEINLIPKTDMRKRP